MNEIGINTRVDLSLLEGSSTEDSVSGIYILSHESQCILKRISNQIWHI